MKDIIVTDDAPKPIGPYSQAVRANGFLFAAQIALDPHTNKFLEGDVVQQTERVLENLRAILTHAGVSLSQVVKTTVFLKDRLQRASGLWRTTAFVRPSVDSQALAGHTSPRIAGPCRALAAAPSSVGQIP